MPDQENPKEAFGRLKPQMHKVPMKPMIGVAKVMEVGAGKYGVKNWRVQPINASTYYSAIHRHLTQYWEDGENEDDETKQHHLCHVIACSLIILDGLNHGSLNDDREFAEALLSKLPPPKG